MLCIYILEVLLLSKPEVTSPCITVHLMKLRKVLIVDRVGSRRPRRSVTVLTQWLGDTSRAREENSRTR